MNMLLREIRVSLQQLDLGLKVSGGGLEDAAPRQKVLTGWPFFSVQGGADAVACGGSPAVRLEL